MKKILFILIAESALSVGCKKCFDCEQKAVTYKDGYVSYTQTNIYQWCDDDATDAVYQTERNWSLDGSNYQQKVYVNCE